MNVADSEGITLQKQMEAISTVREQQIQQYKPSGAQTSLQRQVQRYMRGGK